MTKSANTGTGTANTALFQQSLKTKGLSLLIFPRLIGFEIDRAEVGRRRMDAAKSAVRQGCLFARPAGAINLKMPKAPVGLNIHNKIFCFVFSL